MPKDSVISSDQPEKISPNLPIAEVKGLSRELCAKLKYYDVATLQDLSERISRSQLSKMRGVGVKTLQLIERQLALAGLALSDHHRYLTPSHQQQLTAYQQQIQTLSERTDAWVKSQRNDIWQARQDNEAGAFSGYVKAQLAALEWIDGDSTIKREFEHQLVRSLHRYEKQKRYAIGREALKDTITSQARKKERWKRGKPDDTKLS